jgi:hypothetical protein
LTRAFLRFSRLAAKKRGLLRWLLTITYNLCPSVHYKFWQKQLYILPTNILILYNLNYISYIKLTQLLQHSPPFDSLRINPTHFPSTIQCRRSLRVTSGSVALTYERFLNPSLFSRVALISRGWLLFLEGIVFELVLKCVNVYLS